LSRISKVCLVYKAHPALAKVPKKYKDAVVESIALDLQLSIAAPLIEEPDYWQRRAKAAFPVASVAEHGNSWKRLYFELYIRQELENFEPSSDDSVMAAGLKNLMVDLKLASPFVERIELRQLKPTNIIVRPDDDEREMTNTRKEGTKQSPIDHLDMGVVIKSLVNLKALKIHFGYI
jgi:hypothetical protein